MGLIRSRTTACIIAAMVCFPSTGRAAATVLHGFDDQASGASPNAQLLVGQDGRIYGSALYGGANLFGTIFSVGRDGSFSLLRSFAGWDGVGSSATLLQRSDGTLIGSTGHGFDDPDNDATDFGGLLYSMSADGGNFTSLYRFPPFPAPSYPTGLIDGRDGFFYGITHSGGANNGGALFRWAPGGTPTILREFGYAHNGWPGGLLTLGSDGLLYGIVQSNEGADSDGYAFVVQRNGQNFRELHVFTGGPGGYWPVPGLVEVDGAFYGVTRSGAVYRMSKEGEVVTLMTFDGDNGGSPLGPLALGPDGWLYGFTNGSYSSNNDGALFKVSPQGEFMNLLLLTSPLGRFPSGGPVFAADGMLFGAMSTGRGGPVTYGSVIQVDVLNAQPAQIKMDKICFKSEICPTPINVRLGQTYSIFWKTANLTQCVASGNWKGKKPLAGHLLDVRALRVGKLKYRLDCTGPGGSASQLLTITVGL